ncbi:E3 ubiquitin-protein ligase NEURL3-like [Stigmatopora nigra]
MPKICGVLCLGPLTFHPSAIGDGVHLSQGYCHAKRATNNFSKGLVFSNRPVKTQERIQLLIEAETPRWEGAMRVGFTNVAPESHSLPLPDLAIPDLINTSGHWAVPVPAGLCKAGSELEFWVSRSGSIYIANQCGWKKKILQGVDLSKPLWAMMDIYGKTCSIILLGSKKGFGCLTRRSCDTSQYQSFDTHASISTVSPHLEATRDKIEDKIGCVVCMSRGATVTLPCAHRCLCEKCFVRVMENFGTCPLCRHPIREDFHSNSL